MSDSKKGGGGGVLALVVVAGVAVYAGPTVWEEVKPKPKAMTPAQKESLSRTVEAQLADPMAQCLDSLGNCLVWQPCPVEQAKAYLRNNRMIRDVEDTVHGTLLEVCQKADSSGNAKEWAKALMWRAYRRQIDFYRRGLRRADFDDDTFLVMTPAEYEQDPMADRALHRALRKLDVTDRCVIEARYFDDKDDVTIQRDCNVASRDMVRKRLERGRKQLKAEIDRVVVKVPELSREVRARFRETLQSGQGDGAPSGYPGPGAATWRTRRASPLVDENGYRIAPSTNRTGYAPSYDDDDD